MPPVGPGSLAVDTLKPASRPRVSNGGGNRGGARSTKASASARGARGSTEAGWDRATQRLAALSTVAFVFLNVPQVSKRPRAGPWSASSTPDRQSLAYRRLRIVHHRHAIGRPL
jgi:hypothetical protein